jgi:hypothetical protein
VLVVLLALLEPQTQVVYQVLALSLQQLHLLVAVAVAHLMLLVHLVVRAVAVEAQTN